MDHPVYYETEFQKYSNSKRNRIQQLEKLAKTSSVEKNVTCYATKFIFSVSTLLKCQGGSVEGATPLIEQGLC